MTEKEKAVEVLSEQISKFMEGVPGEDDRDWSSVEMANALYDAGYRLPAPLSPTDERKKFIEYLMNELPKKSRWLYEGLEEDFQTWLAANRKGMEQPKCPHCLGSPLGVVLPNCHVCHGTGFVPPQDEEIRETRLNAAELLYYFGMEFYDKDSCVKPIVIKLLDMQIERTASHYEARKGSAGRSHDSQ